MNLKPTKKGWKTFSLPTKWLYRGLRNIEPIVFIRSAAEKIGKFPSNHDRNMMNYSEYLCWVYGDCEELIEDLLNHFQTILEESVEVTFSLRVTTYKLKNFFYNLVEVYHPAEDLFKQRYPIVGHLSRNPITL